VKRPAPEPGPWRDPAPQTPAATQAPAPVQVGRAAPIDEQARRLADFFNGEVVSDVAEEGL
jgi:DNA polymerase-3 subunit gamma/tau